MIDEVKKWTDFTKEVAVLSNGTHLESLPKDCMSFGEDTNNTAVGVAWLWDEEPVSFPTNYTSIGNVHFDDLNTDEEYQAYIDQLIEAGYEYSFICPELNCTVHFLVNGEVYKTKDEADIFAKEQRDDGRDIDIFPLKVMREFDI